MHIIKHFLTITEHRHKVMLHCFKCGIFMQGLKHDLSKYSPTEFFNGAKYYTGTKSPNEGERTDRGYSLAWMHHKGRNKHHFEYWTDISPVTKRYEPVPMPQKYVVEMFCDRVAACKVYMKDKYTDDAAYNYFIKGHAKAEMHPETANKLESYLKMLKDEGEEKTFNFIKSEIKKSKKETKK